MQKAAIRPPFYLQEIQNLTVSQPAVASSGGMGNP
jgi:hypothetical protein